jgi:monomeric isocitrate dehydrogenase
MLNVNFKPHADELISKVICIIRNFPGGYGETLDIGGYFIIIDRRQCIYK